MSNNSFLPLNNNEDEKRVLLTQYAPDVTEFRVYKVQKRWYRVPTWFKEFVYLSGFDKPKRKTKFAKKAVKLFVDSELQIKYVETMCFVELYRYYLKLRRKNNG